MHDKIALRPLHEPQELPPHKSSCSAYSLHNIIFTVHTERTVKSSCLQTRHNLSVPSVSDSYTCVTLCPLNYLQAFMRLADYTTFLLVMFVFIYASTPPLFLIFHFPQIALWCKKCSTKQPLRASINRLRNILIHNKD